MRKKVEKKMMRQIKKVFLTSEGLEEIKNELTNLLEIQKPRVTKRIQVAREFGDISENSEYDSAKEELSMVDGRITQLEDLLKNYQLIAKKTQKPDFVVIGSTVVVEVSGEVDEFMIVGSPEADPAKKRISNESPVGQALLGAKIGEVVEVTTPIVKAKYKIIKIK